MLDDSLLNPTTARGEASSARLTSSGLGEGEGRRMDASCREARAMAIPLAMACFSRGGEEELLVGMGERGQMGVPAADERGEGLEVVLTVPAH